MNRITKQILSLIGLLACFQTNFALEASNNHDKMNMKKITKENVIVLDPARLQTIGITFEPAQRQMVEKIIHTVGYIETDERLVAHIHVRFDGWIEKLFVNFTGEKIKKNDPLFSVYSPDLVSTQQEYLLAMQAKKILGKKQNSTIASGSEASLEAAKQRLLLWDISEKAIEQLGRTKKITNTMTIYSPMNGTVTHKTAFAGMKIKPGDELYTIADLSHLWILGDIYEYELPYIKLNQTADVTLSYLPNQVFKAKLNFIYPTVEMKTRTVKVRFEIDNTKDQLKPGMYVDLKVKIPLGRHLVVSRNSILLTGERAVIFIYHGDGKIEWRNVTLGVRAGDVVEVIQGIQEGEKIITSANFLIDSESQLKSAMGGMQH
jgi:Cu(I)/Ag(I) efflux system membrane fusion protein